MRLVTPVLVQVILLAAVCMPQAQGAGNETNSLISPRLNVQLNTQGCCGVSYTPPAGTSDTNAFKLQLIRESEDGQQTTIPETGGQGGGIHNWEDRTAERGKTYTYTADYDSDRHHASESLLVYVPRKADTHPVSPSDPLFVEVYGNLYPSLEVPFLVEARASIPGGTFSWTPVNSNSAITLAVSADRALLRMERCGLDNRAMWRLEYRVGHLKWTEIVAPFFMTVMWTPLMTVIGGNTTIEDLRKNPSLLSDQIYRDFNPSNVNSMARGGTRSLLRQVGTQALGVVEVCYDNITDSAMQNELLSTMIDMSTESTLSRLQSRVFKSGDLLQIRTILYPALTRLSAGSPDDFRAGISSLLHHNDPCVRWLLAQGLACCKNVKNCALSLLDEMKLHDPSASVRWMAARSSWKLTNRGPNSTEPQTRVTLRRWEPVFPADAELARGLLRNAIDEIRNGSSVPHTTKFAVLGGGAFVASTLERPRTSDDLHWYVQPESSLSRLALMPEAFLYLLQQHELSHDSTEVNMIVEWMKAVHHEFADAFGKAWNQQPGRQP